MNDNQTIKFVDLKAQYFSIKDEIDNAIKNVIDNTAFIMGENVTNFEKEFAAYCNAKHCVGVSNGTSALFLALKSAGIKHDDEVITVPNTFIATAEVITHCGAKVKFVDIDPKIYTINVDKIKNAITPQTKAIIPVHLFGQSCNMKPIKEIAEENDLIVIEDCAQAHGAEFNNKKVPVGDIGCFSFFPGKNLGCYGDGGAVVTNNDEIAKKVDAWRNHGRKHGSKYEHDFEGLNERLDALQAAVLKVKLKYLDKWTEARRRNARLYNELLSNVDDVITPFEADYAKHVYHLYVIKTKNREKRDKLQQFLKDNKIECGVHYPIPLHLQSAYRYMNLNEESFPVTEEAANTMLSLPMFPEMTEEQIRYVVEKIKVYYNG
ncbi:DegT/DnrJ/EryC1/StrS family aminotransferase [Candidatus Woesearchaeota archaeon]|nr:DegT/DnrJ/EryC1/StrS family aminotransferase [Candidatus Woesearchaeota archaeon]